MDYFVNQDGITVVCGPVSSITNTTVPQQELQAISKGFNVFTYPNPSATNFTITVKANSINEKVIMQVVDMYGDRYKPGAYFVRIFQGKEHKEIKLIKLAD